MRKILYVLTLTMLLVPVFGVIGPVRADVDSAFMSVPDPFCSHDKRGNCGAKNWMIEYCNHLGCMWKYSKACTYCQTNHSNGNFECWREEIIYKREFRRH